MALIETIDSSGLDRHALTLADLVNDNLAVIPVGERAVIHVKDEEGREATQAFLEWETLTDGSRVANLVIHFDRKLG